jgi:transcriptional repressor NrdR
VRCPWCGHLEDRVVDSRDAQEGLATRRRRECDGCSRRFTTYERIEEILPQVVKKDGRREPFDRKKIVEGVARACQKRPVSAEQVEALVAGVERQLQELGEREIRTAVIGEAVMRRLRALDEVAYVRFASVYRAFRDVAEFMTELEELVRKGPGQPAAQGRAAAPLAPAASPPRPPPPARPKEDP